MLLQLPLESDWCWHIEGLLRLLPFSVTHPFLCSCLSPKLSHYTAPASVLLRFILGESGWKRDHQQGLNQHSEGLDARNVQLSPTLSSLGDIIWSGPMAKLWTHNFALGHGYAPTFENSENIEISCIKLRCGGGKMYWVALYWISCLSCLCCIDLLDFCWFARFFVNCLQLHRHYRSDPEWLALGWVKKQKLVI